MANLQRIKEQIYKIIAKSWYRSIQRNAVVVQRTALRRFRPSCQWLQSNEHLLYRIHPTALPRDSTCSHQPSKNKRNRWPLNSATYVYKNPSLNWRNYFDNYNLGMTNPLKVQIWRKQPKCQTSNKMCVYYVIKMKRKYIICNL